MGKECLQIFLNLKLSDEERNDINECVKALESYFKPEKCLGPRTTYAKDMDFSLHAVMLQLRYRTMNIKC